MVSRSRRYLSGGLVCVLVAFGLVNAASALLSSPTPAEPVALHSTQQIVEPAQAPTVIAATNPR